MENQNSKKVLYSGIQPTGVITLGNYFGAVKNWLQLQADSQSDFLSYCSIVDLHSITVRQEPKALRENTKKLLAFYIAAGLDPNQNILYLQSSVRQHAELSWILNCFTYMGELSRMTQFKDKSQRHGENINAGLFTYPVLMAADILLYQTDVVPIGDDQKQHLELARDIAIRMNNEYQGLFKVPEAYYGKVGARIKSLQEPEKKMSKSDENSNAYISVLDDATQIRNKIKRAVTDSLGEINYSEEQPGVKNLLDLYMCATGESKEKALERFAGQGYGVLKEEVASALIAELEPIQKEFNRILADKTYLETILKENGQKASYAAEKTLRKVKKKIGFLEI
ncbi:MAG: tryptophan--tRNA ligase [Eubacteriales bacterium]|nr:tryptophan--tRNA ligase [Eubacteriales bacterium]